MTSLSFTQVNHSIEKSEFSLLRSYIDQEVSTESIRRLIETTQNSNQTEICFYSFSIPIYLDKCYQLSDSFGEFLVHQQRRALNFAQQIIYRHVKNVCAQPNQVVVRFIYDKLPARPEFRIVPSISQAELLLRTHPVRLTGTVMASSAIMPYIRGLKYNCQSQMCPLNDRKRQKFILFDIERPRTCRVGETFICNGCDSALIEDINKRWVSEKLMIAVRIKEQEMPIVHSMLSAIDLETMLSATYNMVVRDEFVSIIQLGGRYNFTCHSIYDSQSNQILFETLHCEPIQIRSSALPDSIQRLHNNFSQYHSFSFLNILSTLFCPHIRLAKYCTQVKMGLILSLVSSSLHILIVGSESRLADILCQTALKYARCSIIHRQQYPLTLASISKTKHRYFVVSGIDNNSLPSTHVTISFIFFLINQAGSIAIGNGGITYLESIDVLNKIQTKQLISAFETKLLSIEVNRSEESSKIVYDVPFNSNIWAYHDSRLWTRTERIIEPTNDLSPALADAFSLVLPLDEIEHEYEDTVENYLDFIMSNNDSHEPIDQRTSQWIDDIRSFLSYARTLDIPLGFEAEHLLKKYFCACRRTKRTLFAYTELPASTTDTLTQVCEAIGKCNVHPEATESDMILAIYIFEISTMTRLGCENLVNDQYRAPPVLTDPMLIDQIEHRMKLFSQELTAFCDQYTPSTHYHSSSTSQF